MSRLKSKTKERKREHSEGKEVVVISLREGEGAVLFAAGYKAKANSHRT